MTTLIPKFDLMNGGTTPLGAINRAINLKLNDMVSVKDFGATGNGTTDDTAAIQAALNSSRDIWFPSGSYVISSSLQLSVTKKIIGESSSAFGSVKNQVKILPNGNFPCFINASGVTGNQYEIRGFNIYWSLTTPTNQTTDGNKYGIYFVLNGTSQFTAPYSVFADIEVNGGWGVYYDNTDNYLNKFERVVGRYCTNGFYKRLGTLMHFEECGNSIGQQGFYFDTTISPILINCACDTLTPISTTPGLSGNYFTNCNSISIMGWDAEGAYINGSDYSYMNFNNVTGTLSGFTGIGNTLNSAVGQFVCWFLITNNSNITISGVNTKFAGTNSLTFTGGSGTSGDVATVRCIAGSNATIISSTLNAPYNGYPTNRYSIYSSGGNITLIDSIWDNQYQIPTRIVSGNVISTNIIATTNFQFVGAQSYYSGSAAPTTGTYNQGDVVFNTAPTSGGYIGWVCTAAGTPGTWKTFGLIS